VVWSYSGVRPLYDDTESDPSAVTRDYVLELESGPELAPLLTVFGGKITTYRRLAEEAIEKLARPFTWRLKPWTARAPLPGGDMPKGDFEAFVVDLRRRYAWLPGPLARRLARAYGTRVAELLGDANGLADLGEDLGAGLTEREADYMIETEWALTAHDILWRRSKLGLHGGAALRERTEAWIAARGARKPL
jgi:glycerol-3-phosphate dehydrogenase